MSEIRLNPKSEFELEKLMTFFEALTKEREDCQRESMEQRGTISERYDDDLFVRFSTNK